MFGIGPMELVVVAAVALMLFSPKELPQMLRNVARVWGQLRATADEFKDAIMTADGVDEFKDFVQGTKQDIRKAEDAARRELMKARVDMRKAQQKLATAAKANEAAQRKEVEGIADEKPEAGAPEPPEPDAVAPASAAPKPPQPSSRDASSAPDTAASDAPIAPPGTVASGSGAGYMDADDKASGKDANQGAA